MLLGVTVGTHPPGRAQSVLVTVGAQMGPAVGLNTVLGANEGTALEGAKVTWWVRTRVLGETVGVTNEVRCLGCILVAASVAGQRFCGCGATD